MTTVTTLEEATNAQNRVMSIRKKFETLCHLEHLDISAPEVKREPKYLFQRSATTFNLSTALSRRNNNSNNNNNKENGRSNAITALTAATTGHELSSHGKCKSEALSLLRKSLRRPEGGNKKLVVAKAEDKTASEAPTIINQRTTPTKMLVRQSSDPRRASIKRSPAFRVGETHQKIALVKSSSLNDCGVGGQSKNHKNVDDGHQQLTATLRKALKQPLPPGPPPKKPPRLLPSPTTPTSSKPFPIQEETHQTTNNDNTNRLGESPSTGAVVLAMKKKKSNNNEDGCWSKKLANGIKSNVNQISLAVAASAATATTRPSAGLLCCNNSANVYDDVANSCYQETQRLIPKVGETQKLNGKVGGGGGVGRNSEPIYMEPFQHLTMNFHTNGNDTVAAKPKPQVQQRRFSTDGLNGVEKRNIDNNKWGRSPGSLSSSSGRGAMREKVTMMDVGEQEDEEEQYNDFGVDEEQLMAADDSKSITGSIQTTCSCPEQHTAAVEKLQDLHYLCTNLSDQTLTNGRPKDSHHQSPYHEPQQHHDNPVDSDMHDNEPPLSLGKTYEEINLLVNAAFNKRLKSPASSMDDADECNMGNNSVSAAAVSSSSSKTLPGVKQIVKLTRSLTEKRKDYVRRISIKGPEAIPSIVSSNYGALNKTFKSPVRTFTTSESPRASPEAVDEREMEAESTGDRIKRFQKLILDNNNNNSSIVEKDMTPKLFKCCLLVGFNLSTNSPYKKFVYPGVTKGDESSSPAPDNIEHLIFPTRNLLNQKKSNQEYSLILTDDDGLQLFGYCRRVLPENCEYCLPLAYCIVSEKKAPGFYFRVLKEIEMRHGQTEGQAMVLLRHLHVCPLPDPGKFLHIKINLNTVTRRLGMMSSHKVSPKRMSLEANPKWLTEVSMATLERRENEEKKRNGTAVSSTSVDDKTLSFINRGGVLKNGSPGEPRMEEILIRRPTDLRLESTELSTLYDSLGSELLLHAFSSLLLERKVILFGENISIVTGCVLGLQTILYPFKWQHTLVTILPENLLEICQAPFPVLAGTLTGIECDLEDGLVIDVDRRLLVQHCGDECTILPPSLRSSLSMSLEMVNMIDQGKMLSNVLIAEAFLRFFVELFANYKQKSFDKEIFIRSHPVASVNLFLEWFVETSLFRHFWYNKPQFGGEAGERIVADHQLEENYYALFDAKLLEKAENKSKTDQSIENVMKNCKLINKKAKTFKERFKHFFD